MNDPEGFNSPERVKECRALMEKQFGPAVTKRTLRKILNRETFEREYGKENQ